VLLLIVTLLQATSKREPFVAAYTVTATVARGALSMVAFSATSVNLFINDVVTVIDSQ
jgi:hypothetical protein